MSLRVPAVLITGLLFLGPALFAVPVVLHLDGQGELNDKPFELRVTLSAAVGSADQPDLEPRVARVPGSLVYEVPEGSSWRVEVEAEGVWAPTKFLEAREGTETNLRLYPTGWLTADLDFEGEARPGPLQVGFRFTGSETWEWTSCPVATDRVWRCEVPRGRLDLRLARSGYAADRRWGVQVPVSDPADLGRVRLRRTASLVGSVTLSELEQPRPPVRIELIPLRDRRPSPNQERFDGLGQSTTADAAGVFHFQDIAPGTYSVQASAPGFAPLQVMPLILQAGREANLPAPMHLERPVTFRLSVDPPTKPSGAGWTVELIPLDGVEGTSLERFTGRVESDGSWTRAGLTPGHYGVTLSDNGESIWWQTELEVEGGMLPVEVDLSVVEVSGRLTFRDKPVRARLNFGGRAAERQIYIYSDHDGRFHGLLPRAGDWVVAGRYKPNGTEQYLREVEVRSGEKNWFDIELPDTMIFGLVVNEDGEPLAGKVVFAKMRGEPGYNNEARTDEQGRFAFVAVPEGRYSVDLLDAVFTAPTVEVEVLEDVELPDVRLVAEDVVRRTGRVVSGRGPVGGAMVHLLPEFRVPRQTPYRQWLTDPAGAFEAELPRTTGSATVIVQPPGHAARMLRLPELPEGDFDIPVGSVGGTLMLDFGADADEALRDEIHSGLYFGDVRADATIFRNWALYHGHSSRGSVRVLPMMEPGDYRLCRNGSDRCAAGRLAPQGELRLALPSRVQSPP